MSKAQEYLAMAKEANFIDAGNILARCVGHEKLVSRLEKMRYQTLAWRLVEAIAFRYQESNQKFMKECIRKYA